MTAHAQPIKEELLREDDVIRKFWPIVGDQLREQVENPKPAPPLEGGGEGADQIPFFRKSSARRRAVSLPAARCSCS